MQPRPFLPFEITQMRRIVEAIVPHNCSVQAFAVNQGWNVSMVICGMTSCHSYNIVPPLDRVSLVRIASAWETGHYEPAADAPRPMAKTLWLHTSEAVIAWARTAKHQQRAAYFEGKLAHFRNDAAEEVRQLQQQSDKRNGKTKNWSMKAERLQKLQAQFDLLNAVEKLQRGNVVDLVQQKKPDDTGAIYFVVRK